jgi:phosphoesterase RecJ-like protein
MDPTYEAVADLIKRSTSFLITSHIDPDGDSVGCQLAISSFISRLSKFIKVVSEDSIPAAYSFLEGSDRVLTHPTEPCEVAIVVDCSSLDRVGWVEDIVKQCPVVVNIDHHKSNQSFGHHNLVDTKAGACGEIVYSLLQLFDQELERAEAEALYTAILSDTGCFRFPTTTSDTLMIAAGLLRLGVRPSDVASEIFWNRSSEGLRMLGNALSTIEVTNGGKVATMEVTQGMYLETGAASRDTEGFANYPRSISGVEVGILLREVSDQAFRVSLRSNEGFDVDGIAKSFGGGGHATAAGFRIEGSLESIKARVREEIRAKILNRKTPSE